jgi:hypothetical protein
MVSPWSDGVWFRVPTRRQGKLKQREVGDERGLQWQLRISVASGFSATLPTPGSSAVTSRLLSSSGSCSEIPSLHPMLTMRDVVQVRPRTEKHVSSRPVAWRWSGPRSSRNVSSSTAQPYYLQPGVVPHVSTGQNTRSLSANINARSVSNHQAYQSHVPGNQSVPTGAQGAFSEVELVSLTALQTASSDRLTSIDTT